MDKFGVETDPPEDKTASETQVCPDCGKPLRDLGNTGVLLCPRCGSLPFEQAPQTNKKVEK